MGLMKVRCIQTLSSALKSSLRAISTHALEKGQGKMYSNFKLTYDVTL